MEYGKTLDRLAPSIALIEVEQALEDAPMSGSTPTARMSARGWRGPVLALGVALAVLLVVGVPLLLQPAAETNTPSSGFVVSVDDSVGLRGLPPEDATTSTPLQGELVVSMWAHFESDEWFSLYLYEDGRVIWRDGFDRETNTGWVEQRLTPEGVVTVHEAVITTGLFDPDTPGQTKHLPATGYIQVRMDDHLVVRWGQSTMDHPIRERLKGLSDWLPASAWADPTPRMYVPASYGVCLAYEQDGLTTTFAPVPEDPSELLEAYPVSVRVLLADAEHYFLDELGDRDLIAASSWHSPHCYQMTTDQARSLVERLFSVGVGGYDSGFGEFVAHNINSQQRTVWMTMVPFMPHGAPPG